jgi:CHAT domain-containing protein
VDDASTAALMSRFYDELEHHAATPVRALQQAQLFLMRSKRWKDPYYWAGFTVEGDWHRDPR